LNCSFLKTKSTALDFFYLLLLVVASFFTTSADIILPNLWLIVILVWAGTSFHKIKFQFTKVEFFLGLIVAYLVFQYGYNAPEKAYWSLNFLKLIAFPLLYLLLVNAVKKLIHYNGIHYLFYAIFLVCFIECGVAILQYLGVLHSNNDFFAVTGSFSSPNHLSVFLALVWAIVIWFLLNHAYVSKLIKASLISLGVLILVLIVLTFSRAGLIVVFTSSIVQLLHLNKVKRFLSSISGLSKSLLLLVVIIVLTTLATFLYLNKKDSVSGRFLIAKTMLHKIIDTPILGHGVFSFVPDYNSAKSNYFNSSQREWDEIKLASYAFDAYNEYLFFAYELGIVFIVLLFVFSIVLFKGYKSNKPLTILGTSILTSIIIVAFLMPIASLLPVLVMAIISIGLLHTPMNQKTLSTTILIGSRILFLFLTSIVSYFLLNFITNNKNLHKHQQALIFNTENQQTSKTGLEELYSKVFHQGYSAYSYGNELINLGDSQKGMELMEYGFSLNKAPKLCQGLAYTNIKQGNYKRAEELLKFNIGNEPYRFEPRMDLFNLYKGLSDYEKAKIIGQEIIDLPVKIPSEEVEAFKTIAKSYLNNDTTKVEKIKGTLSEWYAISSQYLNRSCNYKIYLPEIKYITKKLPVIYITDGQQYLKKEGILNTIERLIDSGKMKPIALVFLDPRDIFDSEKNYRQDYFLCNPNYVDFLVKELIPEVELYSPITNKREDRTILGHSFGGLFSAYIGFKEYNYFQNIAMQSPAFHPCPTIYSLYKEGLKLDLKMYLSYGTGNDTENQDLPMIAILQNKGYDLKVNRVVGGNHTWDVWFAQIEEIMLYFYSK